MPNDLRPGVDTSNMTSEVGPNAACAAQAAASFGRHVAAV
jgi:hypothetical protein